MSRMLFLAGLLLVSTTFAQDFADPAFVAPPAAKALLDDALHPVPQEIVAAYLTHLEQIHTFDVFQGKNAALEAGAPAEKTVVLGEGFPIDLGVTPLFGAPFADGPWTVWLAGAVSVDAYAIRLLVDLSGLAAGQELWVIDPTLPRAFGPIASSEDGVERWLPVVVGDMAVLMVRGRDDSTPGVALTGLSHFFRPFEDAAKELSCHINIACENDDAIQRVSSGVGYVMISKLYMTILGTGSLLNNPATSALEPYFLTANHVIGDNTDATTADVVWDYRSEKCASTAAPDLASLPRSNGTGLLATNKSLDATLIQLDAVPNGDYGRAYLGWDTRTPVLGDSVICIHHPAGTRMRISYGSVQLVDQTVSAIDLEGTLNDYVHETRAGWDRGVTEGGSSGSAVLYANTLRIFGTLTTGSSHVCGGGPTANYDFFSSFRHFYADLTPTYLNGGSGDSSYQPADEEPRYICFRGSIEPPSTGSFGPFIPLLIAFGVLALASRRFVRA